ncbi:unnamed protein product [Closterium sp. Naga37s-1]|nr:unnamed protein product [Closterium sp. Naga37s-1]
MQPASKLPSQTSFHVPSLSQPSRQQEGWSKRMPPMVLFPGYEMQPVLQVARLPPSENAGYRVTFSKQMRALLQAAEKLGSLVKYDWQGFLPNKRQYRMAGLAMMDLRDLVRRTWAVMAEERDRQAAGAAGGGGGGGGGGAAAGAAAGGSGSRRGRRRQQRLQQLQQQQEQEEQQGESEGAEQEDRQEQRQRSKTQDRRRRNKNQQEKEEEEEEQEEEEQQGRRSRGRERRGGGGEAEKGQAQGKVGETIGGWREIYDRVLPAFFVSLVPQRAKEFEEGFGAKEFEEGFGSVTTMLVGQMKNSRYYFIFDRALDIMKGRMLDDGVWNGHNNPVEITPEMKAQIKAAKDAEELWKVIGEDYWVVTPCYSTATPGWLHAAGAPPLLCLSPPVLLPSCAPPLLFSSPPVLLPSCARSLLCSSPPVLLPSCARPFTLYPRCLCPFMNTYVMNGTRLTMVRTPTYYDFAIKTPGTPPRWKEYDHEMEAAWKALCAAYLGTGLKESNITPPHPPFTFLHCVNAVLLPHTRPRALCAAYLDTALKESNITEYRQRIQRAILSLAFYWYNFTPLARGTRHGHVGFVTMLGLFSTTSCLSLGRGRGGLCHHAAHPSHIPPTSLPSLASRIPHLLLIPSHPPIHACRYNFMPLARGTAMVGYVTMLGLFLAADMQITAHVPRGLQRLLPHSPPPRILCSPLSPIQADWEGILSPRLDSFIGALSPWLLLRHLQIPLLLPLYPPLSTISHTGGLGGHPIATPGLLHSGSLPVARPFHRPQLLCSPQPPLRPRHRVSFIPIPITSYPLPFSLPSYPPCTSFPTPPPSPAPALPSSSPTIHPLPPSLSTRQADWEGILSPRLDSFIGALHPWLLPSIDPTALRSTTSPPSPSPSPSHPYTNHLTPPPFPASPSRFLIRILLPLPPSPLYPPPPTPLFHSLPARRIGRASYRHAWTPSLGLSPPGSSHPSTTTALHSTTSPPPLSPSPSHRF